MLLRRRPADPGLLLLGWALLAFGIGRQHGYFHPDALAGVLVGSLAVIAACVGRWRLPVRWGIAAAAAAICLDPFLAGPADHRHGTWYLLSRLAAYPAAVLVLATARWPRLFTAALGLVALTALLRILATPTPPIDVHYLLTDSTRGLLEGRDLYRQSWPGSHGLQNAYPYLPWTSVLLLPAWLLTHEVRVGLLLAAALAAVLARRYGGRRASFPALLLVAYPLFAYQLQQSWTEPLLLALLAGMLLAVQRGRLWLAVVCFAVALATKQHVLLLVPLAAAWPAFGWRRAAAACGLGFALVLPWLVAGPRDLWDDAVLLNLHYPVLRRALDLPALAARHGVQLGFAVTFSALALTYALVLVRLPRDAAGFAVGGGLVELSLDVWNKQSFFNHYTLAMGLVVLGLVAGGLRWPPSGRRRVDQQALVLEDAAA